MQIYASKMIKIRLFSSDFFRRGNGYSVHISGAFAGENFRRDISVSESPLPSIWKCTGTLRDASDSDTSEPGGDLSEAPQEVETLCLRPQR